jgi:hypothetical protein
MNDSLNSALEALKLELIEVEREMEGYSALRVKRHRLIEAIRAVEAVNDAPPNTTPNLFADLATVVDRVRSARIAGHDDPEPHSPVTAALHVLGEAGRPLHTRKLIAFIQARGWFLNRTYESLRSTIAPALDAKAKTGDTVYKPEPGTYGLLRWQGDEQRKAG